MRLRAMLVVLLPVSVLLCGCGGGASLASNTHDIQVTPLQIITSSLPDGVNGSGYSVTLQASGGSGGKTWTIASGSPPNGLALASSGVLSGIPAEGSLPFTAAITFKVSDGTTSATKNLNLRIFAPLSITTTQLPDGTEGQQYSQGLSAIGGAPPLLFSLVSGNLPVGVGLGGDGTVGGTPSQMGTFPFTAQVADSASPPQTTQQQLALLVAPGVLTISTSVLPPGRTNQAYDAVVAAKYGTPPYAWSIASGNLPSGLTINPATGEISGTPDATSSAFTVQATDSGAVPGLATRDLAISVSLAPLGRNNSVASATPISNGLFHASLSPFGDPNYETDPDTDYYKLTAMPGTVVVVETFARRLIPQSMADTVLEIVDGSSTRLTGCDAGSGTFSEPCLNDDIDPGIQRDSRLLFLVPGTPGNPVTLYVHVLNWSGNARPDLLYDLSISGAN